jgi:hypothetical protein
MLKFLKRILIMLDTLFANVSVLKIFAKQVLATFINHFQVRFLESTSTGVIRRNIVVTRRLGLEPMIPGLRGRHYNRQATAPLSSVYILIELGKTLN